MSLGLRTTVAEQLHSVTVATFDKNTFLLTGELTDSQLHCAL